MANCRPLARRPALAPMARIGRPGLLPRWHRQTELLRSAVLGQVKLASSRCDKRHVAIVVCRL